MGLKRNHVILAALGLIVATDGAALLTFYPKPSPPAAAVSTSHTVLYEAEGAGARGLRSATYTVQTADGGTQQGEINLPLKNRQGGTGLTMAGFSSGDFVYLSVQNGDAAGSVTCRITVDGTVISENTSDGGHVIASCKGRVP
jgi:hypothetical protein